LDDGNKVGLGAALAALLVGAGHFGDDLLRGAGRMLSHERPAASLVGDVAEPVAETAISSLQAPTGRTAAGPSADPGTRFKQAVAISATRLSSRWPGRIAFESGSGTLRIGSGRRASTDGAEYREIDLDDAAAVAETPLASCRDPLPASSEAALERCVDKALNAMAAGPAESSHL
jgi:hypothetical protein